MSRILKELQNKNITILGLGIENYALVKFLVTNYRRIIGELSELDITICDKRSKKELGKKYKELVKYRNIKWRLGKDCDKKLYKFDILFRSPGWPLNKIRNPKFEIRNSILSSPIKLFFELCPTKNIIGATGTKGKGTTASLIYEILKKAGKRVWLGGNIGVAPFEFLGKIKKNDWVVLELSSFQLEDMEVSPHIAVITNFYSEHLVPADPNNPNYHLSLKAYKDAKMNIVKYQKKGDWAVINKNFQFFRQRRIRPRRTIFNFQLIFKKLKSKIIYFGESDLPSKLIGEHNKENIAAAVEVAKIVGIKNNIIRKAVAEFRGLEHRLEFVRAIKAPLKVFKSPFPPLLKGELTRHASFRGGNLSLGKLGVIKFYNDSFATTPESAITALKSLSEPVILIAGGAEKNSDFKEFAREVKKRVNFIILLNGDATSRIKSELLKINYLENKIKLVYSIKEAVKIARSVAKAGDIVLLSPACASFGMFKNYKERGFSFKQEVKKIK